MLASRSTAMAPALASSNMGKRASIRSRVRPLIFLLVNNSLIVRVLTGRDEFMGSPQASGIPDAVIRVQAAPGTGAHTLREEGDDVAITPGSATRHQKIESGQHQPAATEWVVRGSDQGV